MASSSQCGNCGHTGHFRANCPNPKGESLRHWSAAKAQYRKEHPEELRKLRERKEENRKWQEDGKTVSFPYLNQALLEMLQIFYDYSKDLDIMGRPVEWEDVNRQLDIYLPMVREICHNGKGFIRHGRVKELCVDGDIFESRLLDLQELRDQVVQTVKSLVNGKLGQLARVNARNDPAELLRYVYATYPPKRAYTIDITRIDGKTLKKVLLQYHPDKQREFDLEWQCICEAITRCLTNALARFQ